MRFPSCVTDPARSPAPPQFSGVVPALLVACDALRVGARHGARRRTSLEPVGGDGGARMRSRSPTCSPTSRSSAPTEIARARRAEPDRARCSASRASRSSRTAGPARVSGVFLRGANRGQTLVLIDGIRIASARVRARPRSKRSRSTRSSGSRSCAARRRASTAPTRSAASSRCSRGAARRVRGNASAGTARTARGTSKAGVSGTTRAAPLSRCRSAARRATASTRSSTRTTSSTTPTGRLHEPERVGERGLRVRARPGA